MKGIIALVLALAAMMFALPATAGIPLPVPLSQEKPLLVSAGGMQFEYDMWGKDKDDKPVLWPVTTWDPKSGTGFPVPCSHEGLGVLLGKISLANAELKLNDQGFPDIERAVVLMDMKPIPCQWQNGLLQFMIAVSDQRPGTFTFTVQITFKAGRVRTMLFNVICLNAKDGTGQMSLSDALSFQAYPPEDPADDPLRIYEWQSSMEAINEGGLGPDLNVIKMAGGIKPSFPISDQIRQGGLKEIPFWRETRIALQNNDAITTVREHAARTLDVKALGLTPGSVPPGTPPVSNPDPGDQKPSLPAPEPTQPTCPFTEGPGADTDHVVVTAIRPIIVKVTVGRGTVSATGNVNLKAPRLEPGGHIAVDKRIISKGGGTVTIFEIDQDGKPFGQGWGL